MRLLYPYEFDVKPLRAAIANSIVALRPCALNSDTGSFATPLPLLLSCILALLVEGLQGHMQRQMTRYWETGLDREEADRLGCEDEGRMNLELAE